MRELGIKTSQIFLGSPISPALQIMSSDILQITTQFTEHSIANVASPCERTVCTTIIQPGEKRFYLAPEGMPNAPGRHVCQPCLQYYLRKHSTTARVVPTATNSSMSV